MKHLKELSTKEAEELFESQENNKEANDNWLAQITEAAEERQRELGIEACDLDAPEGCDTCSG